MDDFPWEDNLLERKTESDLKDLLKTLVAFANSVMPGHTARLLIGEKDDGSIQGVTNPDNIQKRIREECDKIYPPILWRSSVYEREGKHCIQVEIEYDGDTPHFGGPAWIRRGSVTVIAPDYMFQRLIDLRTGIVRELAKWLDKLVTVNGDPSTIPISVSQSSYFHGNIHRWNIEESARITFVNNFWVTFESIETGSKRLSEPIRKLTLSFDDKKGRLKVIVDY